MCVGGVCLLQPLLHPNLSSRPLSGPIRNSKELQLPSSPKGLTGAGQTLQKYVYPKSKNTFTAPDGFSQAVVNRSLKLPAGLLRRTHVWGMNRMQVRFLLNYICYFHVLSHFLLMYICKLHWMSGACRPRIQAGDSLRGVVARTPEGLRSAGNPVPTFVST
jgi:hypothetical protein